MINNTFPILPTVVILLLSKPCIQISCCIRYNLSLVTCLHLCASFSSDVLMWGSRSRCEKKVTSEEAGDAFGCILSCENSLEHEPGQSAREHL